MMNNILVIRFGSLGDILLTSPTILNLKVAFPESHLTYLTKERFHLVVSMIDGVDSIETFPEAGGMRDLMALITRIRKEKFNIVVDLHRNLRSSLVFNSIPAESKIVYHNKRKERMNFVSRNEIPILPEGEEFCHTIDKYNKVLEKLGEKIYCRRPLVTIPGKDKADIRFLETDDPIVVIAPGAAHLPKQYSLDRFARAAQLLQQEISAKIVWVVTSVDHKKLSISDYLPKDKFIQLVDAPLDRIASVIGNATLAIGNDSGISHLATAVGRPVLAIFGPTHPVFGFSPRGIFDVVIETDEYCRPCSLHGKKACIREEQFCFNLITPEMVVQKATEVISQQADRQPALFIDRDGTLIENKHYLSDPDGVELINGSIQALKDAKEAGYKLVILSNQSGVAHGMFSVDDVERVNHRIMEILDFKRVQIDGSYYCPHHPEAEVEGKYKQECNCRKPSAGMAEQAAFDLNLDLRRSAVIGDSLVDINLGRIIGARSFLVRTGHGKEIEQEIRGDSMWCNQDIVFDNLSQVIGHILKV